MSDVQFETENITSSDRILHTPSEFARKNLLYIQEVGSLKSLKPHESSRSGLDSFLFMIVTHGSGKVTLQGKEYHIQEGDAVLLNCNDEYSHISDKKNPWELSWVHFNGQSAPAYYETFVERNKAADGAPVFTPKNLKEYGKILDAIRSEQDDVKTMSEFHTSLHLTKLLTQIISDVTKNPTRSESMKLSKIRTAVNERFQESELLEKLCAEYDVDEVTLNEEYKKKFGIDLYDYILNRRFTYAKELLRFTVKPVKEIVVESGIANADLFRHLFVDKEGMTAEEYRKRWSQWNRG
ncbi:MAG: AraC family transcriptional regulator [Lachnospiraceae bacterium]|nr:AraC family transcriptional regulator [Lachnospiraceae bacterium]